MNLHLKAQCQICKHVYRLDNLSPIQKNCLDLKKGMMLCDDCIEFQMANKLIEEGLFLV